MKFRNACLLLCLSLILSGCHKTITVVKREPVLPPMQYLEYCDTDYGSGSIEDINVGLVAAVGCERAGKDAVKSWALEYQKKEAPEGAESGTD